MRIRPLVLALAALALAAAPSAQTTHIVTVTNFAFSPSNLTIHAGDTVEWHNTDGTHSVQETTSSDPVGFGNEIASAPWMYSFTFTEARATPVTYFCGLHGTDMPGSITITAAASTEPPPESGFALDGPAPNPFTQRASLQLAVARSGEVYAAVHDLAGRRVALLYEGTVSPANALALVWEPAPDVAAGTYLLVVRGDAFEATRRLTFTR